LRFGISEKIQSPFSIFAGEHSLLWCGEATLGRFAITRADLMALRRHLRHCHLDDVRFKQRWDEVGRGAMVGRE
jgi:hypothetical protein